MKWHWQVFDPASVPVSGAFQQSAAYAMAAQATGAQMDVANLVEAGGQSLAQVQTLRRGPLQVVLRGPVWTVPLDVATRHRALRKLARTTRALIVLPEQSAAGLGIIPLMTPRHVALWDLSPEPADLRAAMAGKWRNALRAAERRQLKVTLAPPRALHDLVEAEARQRASRHYVALPPRFTRAIPQNALRLWHWRQAGCRHASMCFVRHGSWATYHLGHADLIARESGAHRVMLWHAALALRAEGVTTLDLGDVNSEDAPGLARFKLGTGAALHRLGATSLVLPG
ncbi:GNAT family N-acetyltransferase [Pseudotabrizicola sp.]|uniref:GNAT family N-acetyltransferase n=1 Tax=Pseudotabrizicola sp. TaxID=2939647 RepID=UPI00272F9F8C|nr:GNAT family N-acetyltransferase [Pseudotabrizicola sp.]MDP2082679.1 GNAT family N-acetyltransferase [Pseudotabrizicola sp.]